MREFIWDEQKLSLAFIHPITQEKREKTSIFLLFFKIIAVLNNLKENCFKSNFSTRIEKRGSRLQNTFNSLFVASGPFT